MVNRMRRTVTLAVVAATLGALFLTGCPDKNDAGGAKADPGKAPAAGSAAPAASAAGKDSKGGW